ncbi:hypothetical protein [Paraburkholderia guartelaensis]|uniref:hypothetical protein n=1 Tax=Paraburkholderia guartelaensis TaxID=2546446 RepID=UPI002AB6621A|nr:hypothetical protein [Paraburkholderia guartelaensis]
MPLQLLHSASRRTHVDLRLDLDQRHVERPFVKWAVDPRVLIQFPWLTSCLTASVTNPLLPAP